jgi:chromatin structure-remodeling complex subunit RSC9
MTSVQTPQPAAAAGGGYAYNPASNPNSTSFTIANYEPRPQIPLTLRPVITPGNNPGLFKDRFKRLREAQAARAAGKDRQNHKGMMLPGSKYTQIVPL